jgi:solute carrier family 35 protein C2
MNSLDPAAHSKRRASTGRNGKQEESKLLANADSDGSKEMEDLTEDEGLQDDEETGLTGNDKERRRGRRRRNTLLDQRIASEVKITPEEKKEADQHVVKKILINGLLIGLWYVFSLSISIVSPLSPSVG